MKLIHTEYRNISIIVNEMVGTNQVMVGVQVGGSTIMGLYLNEAEAVNLVRDVSSVIQDIQVRTRAEFQVDQEKAGKNGLL